MEYYLAIDIGASSGRHVLGWIEDGKLCAEEVYRFPNGAAENYNGELCWDIDALFAEIKNGIKAAVAIGRVPNYIGIDTWGVDFVLVDTAGNRVSDAVCYRSHRTDGMDELLEQTLSAHQLYARTGIQKQIFNTIYQLLALKQQHPEQIERATALLMLPDYFHYLLTGIMATEYTNATTTGLVTPATDSWDYLLIDKLGLPMQIFQMIIPAGSILGPIRADLAEELGCYPMIVLPATHDTGSAVLAVPSEKENSVYLSSGTWSLMGVERKEANLSAVAEYYNFTNEGGYGGTYRFLRNIMGLWMIQSLKKECGYSFDEIMREASKYLHTPYRVDVNDQIFLSPKSMSEALCTRISRDDLPWGELFAIVYLSLAECYAQTIGQIRELIAADIETIHIIGGGSKDDLLNQLTANLSGLPVIAGPTEATAIGNLLAQMMGTGLIRGGAAEARKFLCNSIETKRITPNLQ